MKRRRARSVRSISGTTWRTLAVLGTLLLSLIFTPGESVAQTTCTECVVYAGTELNLRQEPSLQGTVLRFIPRGATVQRTAGEVQNGYAPVIYDRVPGWAVALGFVETEKEVAEFVVPGTGTSSPAPSTNPTASDNARVTLSPLVLRGGPAGDAAPILTMPAGAPVTLTREGAENGYVTVNYSGTIGWAFADLLGEAASGA